MSRKSRIVIQGLGAVSSAGWGVSSMCDVVLRKEALPIAEQRREGTTRAVRVRPVPKPTERLPFLRNPRLRRSSRVSQFSVAASLEALGEERRLATLKGDYHLGVVFVFMNGCVNYSNRFFGEVLDDPSLASPILFPETVFNAPASHLAAMLNSKDPAVTLVGDSAQFLPGVELAIQWLKEGDLDGVVVTGCEELDWLSSEAAMMFAGQAVVSEGAGSLLLELDRGDDDPAPSIQRITPTITFSESTSKRTAAQAVRYYTTENVDDSVLISGIQHTPRLDRAETEAWESWSGTHYRPAHCLGNGMGAGLALQCVLGASLLQRGDYQRALISHVGANQQAVGAVFAAPPHNNFPPS